MAPISWPPPPLSNCSGSLVMRTLTSHWALPCGVPHFRLLPYLHGRSSPPGQWKVQPHWEVASPQSGLGLAVPAVLE